MEGAGERHPAPPRAGTIRDALSEPRAVRAPLGALVGRLPLAVGVLVIVSLVQAHGGSYTLAGVASCAFGLGMAIGHPWLGQRVDGRHGERALVAAAFACAAGWVGIALSVALLPGSGVVLAAAITGLCQPPLSPAMRARWSELVAPHALDRAYAFETTVQEVGFVAGPLLLSLLLLLTTPDVAVFACGGLVVCGALLFASSASPRRQRPPPRPRGLHASPMASAGIRSLAATRGAVSVAIGVALVCVPAFALANGGETLAGLILASWSLGSLFGGAIYASRAWRTPLPRRYLLALSLGILPLAGFALAPGIGVLTALAGLSGLGLAPWAASTDALVQRLAPPGAMTESFTWTASLGLVGEAIGAVVAGLLLDNAGLTAALAATAVIGAGAVLFAFATRASLRPALAVGPLGAVPNCQDNPLFDG